MSQKIFDMLRNEVQVVCEKEESKVMPGFFPWE